MHVQHACGRHCVLVMSRWLENVHLHMHVYMHGLSGFQRVAANGMKRFGMQGHVHIILKW